MYSLKTMKSVYRDYLLETLKELEEENDPETIYIIDAIKRKLAVFEDNTLQ